MTPANQCPAPAAHKRLMDCHAMWHSLANAYMQPDTFRMHLNSLIQGLRNVTFVLQKQKRELSRFETWYTEFQEQARSSPLMRWSVNSRNRIVKESDLELNSEAKIRWVIDWLTEGERKFTFPPRMTSREMLSAIFSDPGNPRVGVITLTRRWVDKALPDYEILHATREVYIALSRLVTTAHEACGVEACAFDTREPLCVTSDLTRDPLRCMEINPATLQEHIDLNAGVGIQEDFLSVPRNEKATQKAKKRYNITEIGQGDAIELAPKILKAAHTILERDKKHANFAWFFRGDKVVDFVSPMYADQNAKYLTFHRLADRVETLRADGFVYLAETWYVTDPKFDEHGRLIPARDRGKDRLEALQIFGVTRDGRRITLTTPFSRNRLGKVILGETLTDSDIEDMNYLGPLGPIAERWKTMDARGED
ncbi:hypothetical protein ACIQMZ_22590 [Streptomyces longwoodensis]|uniref:hypothetical protein n=1 Tax=Streptomyces longwoodensis TaxID=68231 RepID=UPI003817DD12